MGKKVLGVELPFGVAWAKRSGPRGSMLLGCLARNGSGS